MPEGREYDVKAAFIYNIVNFTTWPPDAFSSASDPIDVCVLGADPFGPALDRMLEGSNASGRPITLERLRDDGAAARCSLVFVPAAASVRVPQLLRAIGDRPILTVGESPDFLKQGGIINFVIDNGRVRFDVNVNAATARRLSLSSRLLRVARHTIGAGS